LSRCGRSSTSVRRRQFAHPHPHLARAAATGSFKVLDPMSPGSWNQLSFTGLLLSCPSSDEPRSALDHFGPRDASSRSASAVPCPGSHARPLPPAPRPTVLPWLRPDRRPPPRLPAPFHPARANRMNDSGSRRTDERRPGWAVWDGDLPPRRMLRRTPPLQHRCHLRPSTRPTCDPAPRPSRRIASFPVAAGTPGRAARLCPGSSEPSNPSPRFPRVPPIHCARPVPCPRRPLGTSGRPEQQNGPPDPAPRPWPPLATPVVTTTSAVGGLSATACA